MVDDAAAIVSAYLEATQRARKERSEEAWTAVRHLLAPDVEFRIAGGSSGEVWRTRVGIDSALSRLARAEVAWDRLRTETVSVFGSGSRVAVEQISTVVHDDGTETEHPRCFVFDVEGGRICRLAVYRNEA